MIDRKALIFKPGMLRRYWRHLPVIRLWFMYVWPERCMSCDRRWRDHRDECYFA